MKYMTRNTSTIGSSAPLANLRHRSRFAVRPTRSARKLVTSAVAGVLFGLASLPSGAMAASFTWQKQPWEILGVGGYYSLVYYCPPGQQAIAGGWDSLVNSSYGTGLRVVSSFAIPPYGWGWEVINEGPKPAQFQVHYTCYKP